MRLTLLPKAMHLIRENRSLWRYFWQPILMALPVYAFIAWGLSYLLLPVLSGWFKDLGIPDWAAWLTYFTLWFTVSSTVFLAVVSLMGGWLWDGLSRKTEELVTGQSAEGRLGCMGLLKDTLTRSAFLAFATVVLLIATACIPIAGPIVITGVMALLDGSAPAYFRREVHFPEQLRRLRGLPEAIPTILAMGAISMIPFVNLFIMPLFVVTGTLLVMEEDRQRSLPPSFKPAK